MRLAVTERGHGDQVLAEFKESEVKRDRKGQFSEKAELPEISVPSSVAPSPADVMKEAPAEARSVVQRNYAGKKESFDINAMLRTGTEVQGRAHTLMLQRMASEMDEAMEQAGAIRFQSKSSHSGDLEDGVSVVRVDSLPDQVAEMDDNPAEWVGRSFVDKGFGSTSVDVARVYGGGQLKPPLIPRQGTGYWRLTVDPRMKAVWGANDTEQELVLDRDARYTITKVERPSPEAVRAQAQIEFEDLLEEWELDPDFAAESPRGKPTFEQTLKELEGYLGWIVHAKVEPDWVKPGG